MMFNLFLTNVNIIPIIAIIKIYIYMVSCPVLTDPPPWYGGGGRDSDTVYTLYIHSM